MIPNLQRFPDEANFPQVADRLAEVEVGIRKREPRGHLTIFIEATGLGSPLIELVRSRLKSRVRPVYFTHGDRRTDHYTHIDLGKALLVSRLQVLLQTGRVHLPKTPQTTVLAEELAAFEVDVKPDANDRYGAFPVGTQDDLVTALGLAVQVDSVSRAGVMKHHR